MPTADAAALPDNARCPRCGGDFRCGVNDGHCACFGLQLGEALRQRIADRYSDCLCVRCLAELARAQELPPGTDRPAGERS
jgi:hypothetical protein